MARGRTSARGRGRKAPQSDGPPDVYREMLAELGSEVESSTQSAVRPIKRRKVGGNHGGAKAEPSAALPARQVDVKPATSLEDGNRLKSTSPGLELQQVDFNPQDSSEDAEDSDDFEDVDIGGGGPAIGPSLGTQNSGRDAGALDLTLQIGQEGGSARSSARKRRAVTHVADKLVVSPAHRLHILCLLAHLSLRNRWCNDVQTQKSLRKLVSRKTREELEDDPTEDQYTRDQKLRSGLRQAISAFQETFNINARGLRRSWWDNSETGIEALDLDELDIITSISDFRDAAKSRSGSRDVGAQLFCSLLRGLGLTVRLVTSLQPLPLNGAFRPQAPSHPAPVRVIRYEDNRSTHDDDVVSAPESGDDGPAWDVSAIRRRLGGKTASAEQTNGSPRASRVQRSAAPEQKKIKESPQPIFWTEVFCPAYQKWITVDPISTQSLAQPSKLEPAQKDIRNSLSYVVGMEEDGSLRDVTRRYASQFNAKTCKTRVDRTAGSEGGQWWSRVLRIYKRLIRLPRDEIEDAEMQRREEREGMPRNIEDFKGHPLYALERHLRRNEVIAPRREVGRTGAGKMGDEAVYRRRDVHTVKSADAWYRLGREIKVGEQALRTAAPKRKARRLSLPSDENSDEEDHKGLYAFSQTVVFRAPPVSNGRMPRNAFGNLDIYVPSMIPPGGVHFLHPNTKHAAKLLGIDFVEAVTGFEFRGRQGSAVIKGAVVAAEYKDAVLEVLHSMARDKAAAEADELQRETLRLWRRFIVGLRIHERVATAYAEDDDDDAGGDEEYQASDTAIDTDEAVNVDFGGGFVNEAPIEASSRDSFNRSLAVSAFDLRSGDWSVIEGPKLADPPQNGSMLDTVNNYIARDGSGSPIRTPRGEGGGFMPADEIDVVPADAGGFVMEDAGGFMPENGGSLPDDGHKETGESSYENLESLDNENHQSAGGATLPKKSLENADSQLSVTHQAADVREARMPTRTNITFDPKTSDVAQVGPRARDAVIDGSKEAESSSSDRSDLGSLLSEDPEDAEADPDWLA